jgi:hypothetical protein
LEYLCIISWSLFGIISIPLEEFWVQQANPLFHMELSVQKRGLACSTLTQDILCSFLFSGINIGEIGTKLGMHTVNNGFLRFENVRIPREQMLMKNSKVLEVCNT